MDYLAVTVQRFTIVLFILYICYLNQKIIQKYFRKIQSLQQKLENQIKEQQEWKLIIDQLQDGFILLKQKDLNIFYKNESVTQIFKQREYSQKNIQIESLSIEEDKNNENTKIYEETKTTYETIDKFFAKFINLEQIQIMDQSDKKYLINVNLYNFQGEGKVLKINFRKGYFNSQNCFLFYIVDQTEQHKIDIMKTSMVGCISHELRTPLNCIINFLNEALEFTTDNKILIDYLIPSLDSAEYLLNIINSILTYTQLQCDIDIETVNDQIDFNQVINQSLKMFRVKAKKKELQLIANIDKNIPSNFITDSQLIKQILINLIGNSLKYTFKGKITVSAELIIDQDINQVKISIEDTGIGIKEQDADKVFLLFKTTDDALNINKSSSHGFGLYTSKKLTQKLAPDDSQSLKFTSEYGKGSNFFFILKNQPKNILEKNNDLSENLSKEEDKSLQIKNNVNEIFNENCDVSAKLSKYSNFYKSYSCKKCTQKSILIVDDDAFNIMALQKVLKSLGHECDTAFNGQQAISKVINRNEITCKTCHQGYTLIIMDNQMPVMDGYEACKKIKKIYSENKNFQIIALTADATKENKSKCMQVGFHQIVYKPFRKQNLKEILSKIFH